jgi:hypothetical protein
MQRDCNWLQAMEGDIDTCHTAILHSGALTPEEVPAGTFAHYMVRDRAPRYAVVEHAIGATYAAYCDADDGQEFWRLGQFWFPFFTSPAPGLLGWERRCSVWVPMDDTHVLNYNFNAPRMEPGQTEPPRRLPIPLLPNTTDWYGRCWLSEASCGAPLAFRTVLEPFNSHGSSMDGPCHGHLSTFTC